MIDETLRKLEERIRAAEGEDSPAGAELLGLVSELRTELATLSETHGDDAVSLAQHTDAAAHGATGVEESILEFETAHPRVVGLVRSLLQTLSEAGI